MNGAIKAGIGIVLISFAFLLFEYVRQSGNTSAAGHGLVYRVEIFGRTHYLAGSLHLLRKVDYPLPTPYSEAYEACDELVFEIGQDGGGGRDQIAAQVLAAGTLEDGQTLRGFLPDDVFSKLSEALDYLEIDPEAVSNHKPWLVGITLAMAKYSKTGASPGYGMEAYFESLAEEDHKTVSGLESINEHLGVFQAFSTEESVEFLSQALNEVYMPEERMMAVTRAWRNGDVDSIDGYLSEGEARFPRFYEKVIDGRNLRWSERLTSRFNRERTLFILVGAGHLGGESGLIELLRKRGATVTQVLGEPP